MEMRKYCCDIKYCFCFTDNKKYDQNATCTCKYLVRFHQYIDQSLGRTPVTSRHQRDGNSRAPKEYHTMKICMASRLRDEAWLTLRAQFDQLGERTPPCDEESRS